MKKIISTILACILLPSLVMAGVYDTKYMAEYSQNLTSAISGIGSNHKRLIFHTTCTLTADCNAPDNIAFEVSENGLIDIDDYDLYIQGDFGCEPGNQAFETTGSGRVYFRGINTIYSTWFSSIANAISNATDKELVVNSDYTLASDCNIPANIAVRMATNKKFTLGAYDVFIHGSFDCPLRQVFNVNSTGRVYFRGAITKIYPEWFGCVGDNSTDDTSNFQKALNCASDCGLELFISKSYSINDSIFMWGTASLIGYGSLRFKPQSTNNPLTWITLGVSAYGSNETNANGKISGVDLYLDGNSNSDIISCQRVDGFIIEDCYIRGYYGSNTGIEGRNNATITPNPYRRNITIRGNRLHAAQTDVGGEGIGMTHATNISVVGNRIYGWGDDGVGLHSVDQFVVDNNWCSTTDGRLMLNNCTNGSVTNNYCARIASIRDAQYYTGIALIYLSVETTGANNYAVPTNIEVANNILEFPSSCTDNGSGIIVYGGRGIGVHDNVIEINHSSLSYAISINIIQFTGTWTDPDGISTDDIARSRDVLVYNNIVKGTYPGEIYMGGPSSAYFIRNKFWGNTASEFTFFDLSGSFGADNIPCDPNVTDPYESVNGRVITGLKQIGSFIANISDPNDTTYQYAEWVDCNYAGELKLSTVKDIAVKLLKVKSVSAVTTSQVDIDFYVDSNSVDSISYSSTDAACKTLGFYAEDDTVVSTGSTFGIKYRPAADTYVGPANIYIDLYGLEF